MAEAFRYKANPEILLAIPDDLASRQWLRRLVVDTADKALGRLGPTMVSDKKMLREFKDIFALSFDALTGKIDAEIYDQQGIQDWLRLRGGKGTWASGAIEAAFNIGLLCGENDIPAHVRKEWRRSQTMPANIARRNDKIQCIVDGCARALWAKSPKFRNNARGTAEKIQSSVAAKIRDTYGDKPPRGWGTVESGGHDSNKRAIGRITKRVAKLDE